MGQTTSTPSCLPSFNVPQKKLVSTDYPDSMSMHSPRRPTNQSMHSPHRSVNQSPIQKPRLGLKSLIVDEYESPAPTSRSLVDWLIRPKQADFMLETPKGEAKNEFKHFCPICYRYFRSIYSTSCCAGNCCHDCAVNFISLRQSTIKFLANVELPISCPNCNQADGVAFVALSQSDESKHYVESPRTQQLLEQSEARRQSQQIYA